MSELTLKQKAQQLRDTVAMPTQEDWQLLCEDPAETAIVIEKANAILLAALNNGAIQTYGALHEAVWGPLRELDREYPHAGIFDTQARETVGLFFGLNLNPFMSDHMFNSDWEPPRRSA